MKTTFGSEGRWKNPSRRTDPFSTGESHFIDKDLEAPMIQKIWQGLHVLFYLTLFVFSPINMVCFSCPSLKEEKMFNFFPSTSRRIMSPINLPLGYFFQVSFNLTSILVKLQLKLFLNFYSIFFPSLVLPLTLSPGKL